MGFPRVVRSALALMLAFHGEVCAMTDEADRLHYRPEVGVLGDAIPFYHDGVYHVFFMKGRAWAHLRSRDLVRWEELPDAIVASDGKTDPDGEGCWTGSVIEHEGTFHLFYTGKNQHDPLGDQKVMHATSRDLLRWEKHPEHTFYAEGRIYWSKPVNGPVDDRMNYHHQAFRDPEVFWNPDAGAWWMTFHAALADASKAAFALYVSDDLVHWTPRDPIYTFPLAVSGDCPNIFPMDGRWYIIAADRHYTVADAPGGPWAPEMVPYGCGEMFVAKTMFDGWRRVLVGWVRDREGHADAGKGLWGGVLSLARVLYADGRGRLCQRPVAEVVAAFSETVEGLSPTLAAGETLATPPDYMLHGTLHASPDARAALLFRQAEDGSGGYRLEIDLAERRITLGDEHMRFDRVCDIDPERPLDIRLFAVGSVAECFVNNAFAFTIRAFDHGEGRAALEVTRGEARLTGVTVRTRPAPDGR